MKNINIKGYSGEYFIPTVKFNYKKGECLIAGESYLEDTMRFYAPLLDWVKNFVENETKPIKFNFKLNYFNTSSSKRILDILLLLKSYKEKGREVEINWLFEEKDPDMEEDIDDFVIISAVKINKVYENE